MSGDQDFVLREVVGSGLAGLRRRVRPCRTGQGPLAGLEFSGVHHLDLLAQA